MSDYTFNNNINTSLAANVFILLLKAQCVLVIYIGCL